MTTKAPSQPVPDNRFWIQRQSPSGNWVNSTGIPFDPSRPLSIDAALEEARRMVQHEKRFGNVRIIRQYIEIIEE